MITDPHHQLKTDLYTTVPDLLICETVDLPYKVILWGYPISHDEAIRRIDQFGAPGMNYKLWTNPGDGASGTVSVIQTDDKHAKRTVAQGLFCTCYRVITPAQAKAEEDKERLVFPWRLMCRTRPPLESEFDHIAESSDLRLVYHTGYLYDAWHGAPDISCIDTIYAIHVRDYDTAVLLKMTIGDCDLE